MAAGNYGIPADTAVCISILLLHHREDVYPDPWHPDDSSPRGPRGDRLAEAIDGEGGSDASGSDTSGAGESPSPAL